MRQPDKRQEIAPDQIREHRRQYIGDLGKVLGLNPEFVKRVQAQGLTPILERAQAVDRTGAHAVVLSMVALYGNWLESIARQRAQPDPRNAAEIAEEIGTRHGISPELAVHLIGTVHEVYQQALRKMSIRTETPVQSKGETQK